MSLALEFWNLQLFRGLDLPFNSFQVLTRLYPSSATLQACILLGQKQLVLHLFMTNFANCADRKEWIIILEALR